MNANVYYHVGRPEEIEAMLRDGFTNNLERKQNGMRGVFVADFPGELDPDYPDDHLLEITLASTIDLAKWKLVIPQKAVPFGEWLIPAGILNQHAKVRPLTKEQWQAAWDQWQQAWFKAQRKLIAKTRRKLVELGLAEQGIGRGEIELAFDQTREFQIALEQARQIYQKAKDARQTPDPQLIRENAVEQLALKWRDAITGQLTYPELSNLPTAVIFTILNFSDCINSADRYFRDSVVSLRRIANQL